MAATVTKGFSHRFVKRLYKMHLVSLAYRKAQHISTECDCQFCRNQKTAVNGKVIFN